MSSFLFSTFICITLLLFKPGISRGEESPLVIPSAPSSGTDNGVVPSPEEPGSKEVQPSSQERVAPTIAPSEAPVLPPTEGTTPQIKAGVSTTQPSRGLLNWLREDLLKGVELKGYIKNETAYRYVSPTAFSKILNIVQIEPSYSFTQDIKWSARFWAYYDLAYDFQDLDTIAPMKPFTFIQPPDPGKPEPDIRNLRNIQIDKYGVELKEFYFDIFLSKMDFRVGKQIVRWGIVEGWRILDEVNPLDFREHILRDVADRYIPIWMLKGDYYLGPLTVEGIWTPDIRGHKPAPLQSEWSQFQELPDLKKVPRTFKNSEGGLRVSGAVGGYEFALAYFTQWDDFPTAFRSIAGLGLGNLGISPSVDFTPRFTRLHSYGLGLAKSLGKIVLEGEVAYVTGKDWGTCTDCTPLGGKFGELQRNYLKHVVGLKTVLFGADMSLDYSQEIILHYTNDIQQQRHEDAASLFVRKEIRYGTLVPQLLAISLLNRHEYLFRPKLEYRYTDKITFLFGADIFKGDPGPDPGRLNFFGYFSNDSRAYMEVKYSF